MKKFIENHRRGIILSAVCLPFLSIIVLALALLRITNQLFLDYSLSWYCLSQLGLMTVALTTTRSDFRKMLISCSLLLLLMTVPINLAIAIAVPGVLALVLGLLRLYKPQNIFVAFVVGVVAVAIVQCVLKGTEFTLATLVFLVCGYIVAWGIYFLSTLKNKFSEPIKRFLSEDE